MFLNECFPIDEIKLQDINNTPYFVIPIYEVDTDLPPQMEGKNYRAEYYKSREEHIELTKVLQDLLFEREELLSSLQQVEPLPLKRKKTLNYSQRERRRAGDIVRLFECEICGKAYGSEGSLKQHTKLKH